MHSRSVAEQAINKITAFKYFVVYQFSRLIVSCHPSFVSAMDHWGKSFIKLEEEQYSTISMSFQDLRMAYYIQVSPIDGLLIVCLGVNNLTDVFNYYCCCFHILSLGPSDRLVQGKARRPEVQDAKGRPASC